MALFTILTVATEIASNEKAMAGLSQFAKKGSNAIKEFLRDEDDLPELSERDLENLFEFTEMISSLLGQGAKVNGDLDMSKMKVISDIINELCLSEEGYMQEPLLNYLGLTVEKFEENIAYKIKNPFTIKKITRYVEKYELEDEFYTYLCRVMMSDNNITVDEQEFLDAISDSFGINKFDRRALEESYKN